MHNIVLSRFVKAAVVLVAAVALLPASVLGQGAQGEKYQLRRLAGHGLYARDYPAEAFFILEELGDNALASGDTAGAIQAYHDAAWIAGQAAKEADAMFDPKTIGVGVDYRPKAAAQEAQRILEKAMAIGGSGTAELAPLTLDRDLEDREVGMEIGRVLYAIERPYLRSETGGGRAANLRRLQAGRRTVGGEGRQGGRLAAGTIRRPSWFRRWGHEGADGAPWLAGDRAAPAWADQRGGSFNRRYTSPPPPQNLDPS